MAEFPALPLFTDAYLGDTMHLSLEEHGAYLKLLMIMWRSADCAVPDDDERIATMLGITINRWRRRLRPVLEPFLIVDNGFLSQKRLKKVREKVSGLSESQSEKANKRWRRNPLNEKDADDAGGSGGHMPPRLSGISPSDASKTKTISIRDSESLPSSSESLPPRAGAREPPPPPDDEDGPDPPPDGLEGVDRDLLRLILAQIETQGATMASIERQVRALRTAAPAGIINTHLADALARGARNPMAYATKAILTRAVELEVAREVARSPPPEREDPIFEAYRMSLEIARHEREQGTHSGPDGQTSDWLRLAH